MVHRMEPNLETVNDYLVSVFNDILTIEESELKKSQFNDLSITEMHTIEAIGMYKKKTSSEVAKELSITVGTLTVAINNLVKKGYVERFRSEDDRRVVKLGLTKKGKLLFRVHQHFHREMVKNILKGMEQEEEQALLRALKNLHDFLQEYK
ncbi:MarR family transcriptional regulator [Enterococcus faecalis]|nr:MarR family transcriptional regulator [Enterococcus faecalis]